MTYYERARMAAANLERAKQKNQPLNNDWLFLRRVSVNGAITVMAVNRETGESTAVKKSVLESFGVSSDELYDFYEFKALQGKVREFLSKAKQDLSAVIYEKRYSALAPFYDQRRQVYDEYLSSPEWAAKRQECMKYHGSTCVDCEAVAATDIHHLHYETLGNECPDKDLAPLCSKCHAERHESGSLLSRPEKREAGKKVRHPRFGGGTVIQSVGEGSSERVLIQFNDGQRKWLVKAYAQLEHIQ